MVNWSMFKSLPLAFFHNCADYFLPSSSFICLVEIYTRNLQLIFVGEETSRSHQAYRRGLLECSQRLQIGAAHARLGQFRIVLVKTLTFFLKARKDWKTGNWYLERIPNFRTLVENCKLLKICTTRMRSIIAGCSSAIIMHLNTCYKQTEKHWG